MRYYATRGDFLRPCLIRTVILGFLQAIVLMEVLILPCYCFHHLCSGKKAKRGASAEEKVLDGKHAALQEALDQISNTFGKETVMWLGRNPETRNVPVISTGSLSLDSALGVGGLPKVANASFL